MRLKRDEKPIGVGGADGDVGPAHLAGGYAADVAPDVNFSPPWFAGKAWGVLLVTLYPLLAAAPLVIVAALNRVADHLRMAEVGVDCAVVGLTILALQFMITARLSWVEAPFGLDLILVFHRAMALVATALLCVHPVLVARATFGLTASERGREFRGPNAPSAIRRGPLWLTGREECPAGSFWTGTTGAVSRGTRAPTARATGAPQDSRPDDSGLMMAVSSGCPISTRQFLGTQPVLDPKTSSWSARMRNLR